MPRNRTAADITRERPAAAPAGAGVVDATHGVATRSGVAVTSLAVLAAIVVLRYAGDVFVPVVLGVFVSYTLEPIVGWSVRRGVPRRIAAAGVLLALLAAAGGAVYGLSDDVISVADQIPPAAARLRTTLNSRAEDGAGALQKVQKAANEIERSAAEAAGHEEAPRGVTRVQVEEKPFNVRGYVWTGSMGVLGLLSQGVLLLFLVYFILASGDLFQRKLLAIAGPTLSRRRITLEVLNDIERQVQLYFFVLMLANSLVGVASWLVFRALGLERALVWAIAAAVFHSVPYFGPLVLSVTVGVLGFVQSGSVSIAAALGGAELAITGVVGFLVVPWLVGRTARMNEVTVPGCGASSACCSPCRSSSP